MRKSTRKPRAPQSAPPTDQQPARDETREQWAHRLIAQFETCAGEAFGKEDWQESGLFGEAGQQVIVDHHFRQVFAAGSNKKYNIAKLAAAAREAAIMPSDVAVLLDVKNVVSLDAFYARTLGAEKCVFDIDAPEGPSRKDYKPHGLSASDSKIVDDLRNMLDGMDKASRQRSTKNRGGRGCG